MSKDPLELSVMIGNSPHEMAPVHALVDQFTRTTGTPVQFNTFMWNTARESLKQAVIYNEGLDVSQVGSTWLSDFVTMNAVRPFTPAEMRHIGAPEEFVPALWRSASLPYDATVWGIPWTLDARVLFYRRDVLARAGIDEQTAFTSPQALLETLAALQAHGVAMPWVIPTQTLWRTLHAAASWIWGNGGDLVSPNGRRFLFTEAAARDGFRAFFSTARYLCAEARGLSDDESDALFMQGKAAITLSALGILRMAPALLEHVGITAPPGPAFVGGSHLVIWKHSAHSAQALQLVQHLTSAQNPNHSIYHAWQLPARLAALHVVDTPAREFSRYLRHILENGRAFTTPPLWSIIEERLAHTLAQIWVEVLALPNITDNALDAILEQHLGALAQRLELMFI